MLATAVFVLLASGCAHTHLRKSTFSIAGEVPQLQQQQVLDNLARLCAQPEALPYFAIVGGGTVQVVTDHSGAVTLTAAPAIFNLGTSRNVAEQYNVAIVTDPEALDLMRRTYQWTLGIHTEENRQRLAGFFGDDFEKRIPSEPWFGWGPFQNICAEAVCVGRCGHTAVWVTADSIQSLTLLTLAILDLATAGPPVPPIQREVRRTFQGSESGGTLERTEVVTRESAPPKETSRGIELLPAPDTLRGPAAPGALREPAAPMPQRTRRDFYVPDRGLQFTPGR
jgi:hypothetical protein